jgi:hypothetical protein
MQRYICCPIPGIGAQHGLSRNNCGKIVLQRRQLDDVYEKSNDLSQRPNNQWFVAVITRVCYPNSGVENLVFAAPCNNADKRLPEMDSNQWSCRPGYNNNCIICAVVLCCWFVCTVGIGKFLPEVDRAQDIKVLARVFLSEYYVAGAVGGWRKR